MAEDKTVEVPREIEVPTPFGTVHLTPPTLPSLAPPAIDERRTKAMLHAVASDLGTIIGWVPVVGDIVSDVVEDLHSVELRRILTPTEMNEYMRQDKVAPSTIALLRTFMTIRD